MITILIIPHFFRSHELSTRTAWWHLAWTARRSPPRAATTLFVWIRRLPPPSVTPPLRTWEQTPPLRRTARTRRRVSSSMSRTRHTQATTTARWRTESDSLHWYQPSILLHWPTCTTTPGCMPRRGGLCVSVRVCVSGNAGTSWWGPKSQATFILCKYAKIKHTHTHRANTHWWAKTFWLCLKDEQDIYGHNIWAHRCTHTYQSLHTSTDRWKFSDRN